MSSRRLLARRGGELGEVINFDQLAGGELVLVYTGGQLVWWDLGTVELMPGRGAEASPAAEKTMDLPACDHAGAVNAGPGPGCAIAVSARPRLEQLQLT
jgi:hypothetical protein